MPLDGSADHGLLVVNHEYTNAELMFPGIGSAATQGDRSFAGMTKEQVDIEMAAHGGARDRDPQASGGKWQVVRDAQVARRITADDRDGDLRPGRRP